MNYELLEALNQICEEKNIDRKILIETIKKAILSTYIKNNRSTQNLEIDLDEETGKVNIFSTKKVVSTVKNENLEISLEEAKKIKGDVNLEDKIKQTINIKGMTRIFAQTVKQIISQQIMEIEKDNIYEQYRYKIGTIVGAEIQRFEQKDMILRMDKIEALLPFNEQLPYNKDIIGEIIKVYIVDVKRTTKGCQIIVSRTHPNLVIRLFELEVPEINDKIIEIKSVAREAGERSKIAVVSNKNKNIDAVGTCVGIKGIRVQAVIQELKGEKVDIIKWSDDPELFIKDSLKPAIITKIILDRKNKSSIVILPDDQLLLAIGKKGQNVKLAVKLTGWKIDIKSESTYNKEKEDKKKELQKFIVDLGLGEKIIEKLTEVGIISIENLSEINLEDLLKIPGIGEKKAEKILDSLKNIEKK